MPNLLLSTLGNTPDIIEETIGVFNYDDNVDFYRNNKHVQVMRKELKRIDEAWPVSTGYLSDIEQRKLQSQHFFTSYYLNETETRSNFHILYTFPPSKIEQLKNDRIGLNPKMQKQELAWLKRLPKSDLHCHLGGVLTPAELVRVSDMHSWKLEEFCYANPGYMRYYRSNMKANFQKFAKAGWKETVREIADDLGVPRYAVSAPLLHQFEGNEEELKRIWYGACCDEMKFCGIGIERYEQLGDLQGSNLLDDIFGLERTLALLLNRCYEEHVKYIEIRCSPLNYVNSEIPVQLVVNLICRVLEKAYPKVEASLIFSISRHRDDMSRQYVELVKQMSADPLFKKYFRGFDLAGNESARTPEKLRDPFMDILKECYSIAIHAGETEEVESIWQAVCHLNAERVGR